MATATAIHVGGRLRADVRSAVRCQGGHEASRLWYVLSAQGEGEVIDFSTCATFSLAEAAKVLGVHRSTAWDLYKRGEFPVPVLQIGHRLRVTKVHLRRYLLGEA